MSLESLKRRLAAIPVEVRQAVAPIIEAEASRMVATARRFAPDGDGDLDASIRKEDGAHQMQTLVRAGGSSTTRPVRDGASATYDYSHANEWGTADMPANPFFYPAWRLTKKKASAAIRRAMRKAIRGGKR
ncbi:HK97-gp10 family putative phage morphogenesis protein [Methylobrevis pamukkalensis]|uniref:Phage protein, HK97 gp10 family n=1 Tax=Methylobrevis pamukkalensis TaxID=1439726 RepID=A0A1E3GZ54_9HYPH|nr:HK97-gp10 family putative phage morphogenesis protein [Methylobrevis pamukkalensis]ODN68846.1 hypothetical protein A6302_03851 [Methylobrevis pamukkalensis]